MQFLAHNDHPLARVETVTASVPFAYGVVTSLADMSVQDIQAAWRPLQMWPDGSIRIAQVQFTDLIPPGGWKAYEVVRDASPLTGPFQPNEWLAAFGSPVQIGARVQDTFGVPYEAVIQGPGEVVQETFLVRVQRHRLYHRATAVPNIGRDYLTSTFYVTEYCDQPYLTVDWILGNDYLGADDTTGKTDPNWFPLGGLDVKRAEFLARGCAEIRPYMPAKHAIAPGVVDAGGWTSFETMRDTYLDDGQTRRYRFLLRIEDPNASAEIKSAWAQQFEAFSNVPVRTLASLPTWQNTGGLGINGGPINGPSDAYTRAEGEYASWDGRSAQFGTWGDFGDVKYSNTGGTPRNAPLSPELANAVQSSNMHKLVVLEQKAWAQAQRPYHLFGLTVGDEQDILLWDPVPLTPLTRDLSRESLGRRALWSNDPYAAYRTMVDYRAHGWNGYDHEHWSTDLLFDYWTVSGDAWAHEELRQLGQSLKGLMRLQKYTTAWIQSARAEGWCMVGFVQAYLATGDAGLKTYALRRLYEVVNRDRLSLAHASKALVSQGSHTLTGYPFPHEFFMPWQHGAVLYGYLGAYRFFGDPLALQLCEDVPAMLDYSWVSNYQDPLMGWVANGLRYYVPTKYNGQPVLANYFDSTVGVKFGGSLLGGAHGFLVSGLFLMAQETQDAIIRNKAINYGKMMLGPLTDNNRWYKWNVQVVESLAQ